VTDEAARATLEARNALLQFDAVGKLIQVRKPDLNLTPTDVCDLQRIAVQGIFACAGQFRQVPISISNTPHSPPAHANVPGLVAEMCEYANSVSKQPYHVAAYLMWRLNWIHPFADGNGRTSRAVSYLGLSCGLNLELTGTITVPDLIVRDKIPYYDALDAADAAWKAGRLDVSDMETLIQRLLAEQLQS
jgi:fido (protein-threonine AMPylation protein)